MELISLNAVRRFLATATDLNELLDVKRKVEAGQLYAKRTGLHEAQNELAEAKLRIDRRIGQVTRELPREKGGRPSKNSSPEVTSLQEVGMSRKTQRVLEQVASLPEDKFEAYVAETRDRGAEITQAGVLKLARQQEAHEPVEPPPLPEGQYSVIYADPPWKYDFAPHRDGMSIEEHYPTMSTDGICALEIPAAKDAVLFLWATCPKLAEAMRVMDAWGFDYKTNFVWDKEKPAARGAWVSGYWSLPQHELLLIGTRGSFSPPNKELRICSVIREARTKHSKKPVAAYEIIEAYFPKHEKIELFSREARDGWTRWGNE